MRGCRAHCQQTAEADVQAYNETALRGLKTKPVLLGVRLGTGIVGVSAWLRSGRHGSTVAVQRAMQANVVSAHCDTTSVSTLKNQPPVSAPTLEAVVAGHTWWDVIVDKTGTLASNSKLVSRLYRLVEL